MFYIEIFYYTLKSSKLTNLKSFNLLRVCVKVMSVFLKLNLNFHAAWCWSALLFVEVSVVKPQFYHKIRQITNRKEENEARNRTDLSQKKLKAHKLVLLVDDLLFLSIFLQI